MKRLGLSLIATTLLILTSAKAIAGDFPAITRAPNFKTNKFGPVELRDWVTILGCAPVLATLGRPEACYDDEGATIYGFLWAVRTSVNSMSPDDPAQTCRLFGAIEAKRDALRIAIWRLGERIEGKGSVERISGALWSMGSEFGPLGSNNRWGGVTEYCLDGSPDRFSYKFLKIMYLRYMKETVAEFVKEVNAFNKMINVKLPYDRYDGKDLLNDPAVAERMFDSWMQR